MRHSTSNTWFVGSCFFAFNVIKEIPTVSRRLLHAFYDDGFCRPCGDVCAVCGCHHCTAGSDAGSRHTAGRDKNLRQLQTRTEWKTNSWAAIPHGADEGPLASVRARISP